MNGWLPFFLILATTFSLTDLLLKDRRHRSLVAGYPLSVTRILLAKTAVALCGAVTVFGLALLTIVGVNLDQGIGSLAYPVPVLRLTADVTRPIVGFESFDIRSIGSLLGQRVSITDADLFGNHSFKLVGGAMVETRRTDFTTDGGGHFSRATTRSPLVFDYN